MELIPQELIESLMSIGIVSYKEQETVWEMAKRCRDTVGLSSAAAGALLGTHIIPGVGTLGGAAALALVNIGACTAVNFGYHESEEIKRLAKGEL
jgi:hypothetical protein